MGALTILGGKGFIGSEFTKFIGTATGTIRHFLNARDDYQVYSGDVLYLISTTHNYHVMDNPYLDIETNLTTLIKVLENWRAYQKESGDLGTFYFASSWFVYGRIFDSKPVVEDAPCYPSGFYSVTKHAAEGLLSAYCAAHNLSYKIMRFGNVLGASDKDVSARKNVLQHFIREMKAGRKISLVRGGCFSRDFIDVRDLCRALVLIMDSRHASRNIINVGNGTAHLMIDLLTYAADQLNLPGPVTDFNVWGNISYSWFDAVQPTGDYIPYMCLNNDRLVQNLGYKQKYTIWHTLDDLIERL